MKKIKFIVACFALIGFLACDQEDAPFNRVYDSVNGQSLVSFQGSSSDLSVVINETGTVDVFIEVSTASSSDRTISISLDDSSTANPDNYTISTNSVVIPANEYIAMFTIDGVDNSVETTAESIIINIDSTSFESILGTTQHTVNIFQVCPVPADFFVGSYLIEQMSAQIDGYTLSHGSIVEVTAPSETVRSFQTEAYISYCGGSFFAFDINLVCDELIVPLLRTTCSCGGNFDDFFGPATSPESYDITDDSVIFLTFTDDYSSACNAPEQTTYRFTKQ